MRRLTRQEIEAGGCAMPGIMIFHDKLIGAKLIHVSGRRGVTQPPPVMHFSNDITLRTQYDDEGNPGDTEWQITDHEGYLYHPVQVHDLRGHDVTGVGYLLDPENDCRHVIPFVEVANTFYVCCMTPHGGGVIFHDRPGEDRWDLFCQFKPKL
jgi:hypothetical protein